jgi:hypothetical protein
MNPPITYHNVNSLCQENQKLLFRDLESGFLLIAITGEDGKAGILRKARVGEREIAEDEDGAPRGFDETGMNTISAEAGRDAPIRRAFFLSHKSSIAQVAALMDAGGRGF